MPFLPLPVSRVDPRGPRLAAALTTAVLALALVTGGAPMAWLLAAQAAVFALGSVGRSPYAWVFRRIVRPRLRPPAELEDARPVRFAQIVGFLFLVVALAGVVAGSNVLSVAATTAALFAAFLNAAFGICLGCEMYLLLRRGPIARFAPAPQTNPTHPTRTEVSA
ncbi:MAG: DUF4395 domain-containing protein [Actinomycetes bacterium]